MQDKIKKEKEGKSEKMKLKNKEDVDTSKTIKEKKTCSLKEKDALISKKKKAGITLIALVVTIVVLLILAGVSISAVFGDNGLIVQAQLSSFATEMQNMKENVANKKMQVETNLYLQEVSEDLFTQKLNEQDVKMPDTLKKEILYVRAGMPEESEPNDYDIEEFEGLLDESGNVDGIYIIDKKTGNGKEDTYAYDEQTGTVFKIPQTKIGGKVYHSYECAISQKGGTGTSGSSGSVNKAVEQESDVVQVGDEYYYAPNLKGFSSTQTYLVYYSKDFSETKDVPVAEYIEKGQLPKITKDGNAPQASDSEENIYTLHDYSQNEQIWANVKTTGFNQEAWWIWVPRYAYKVNEKPTSSSSPVGIDIIYVGLDDKPLNPKYNGELPKDEDGNALYQVHPAFKAGGKNLKGIWMSKFETSYGGPKSSELAPDMTGFDANNTYIELFDEASGTFNEEVLLSKANLSTINNGNKWYDYKNEVWANIKTVGDGQEAWWVWIPRYAYNVRSQEKVDIIYVDEKDRPISTEYNGKLPEDYEVHPAFNASGKKLKGLWISKYEPSLGDATGTNNVMPPNMTGFDPQKTYIELFDPDTQTFNDEKLLANVNLDTINNENKWYDYPNEVWANIKTVGEDKNGNVQEAWWVWVPRYAYNVVAGGSVMDIIFVDTNNKPLDKKYGEELQPIYLVHPAFTVEGKAPLDGIWMSKYEPSKSVGTVDP